MNRSQQQPHSMPEQEQTPPVILPTGRLQQDIEGDNVILYRSRRFFVRTANNPNQRKHPLRVRSGGATSQLGASFIDQVRWIAEEKLRIVREPTRLLPDTEAINPVHTSTIAFPVLLEAIVLVLGIALIAVVHGINLFGYPAYGQNEGTLMANAWAILHGKIEPNAYIYDQPPLGWIQIAGWLSVSGGIFAFGNAIASGRVFMLILTAASALLVCLIARRLSGSRSVGLLAMLIYGLSPISILFQRQVLLENIGAFWVLTALYLLVAGDSRMRGVLLAAIALGIAILTKLAFAVFIPVLLYTVWLHSTKFQRKFAVVLFFYVTLSLASGYLLLAALKGELFPTGWLPWDHHAHPSLIASLLAQLVQPAGGSTLVQSWNVWLGIDPIFVMAGLAAVAINLLAGFWNRLHWIPALLAVSFALFLLRGSPVYPFFVVPLLPLAALNIALAINALLRFAAARIHFDLGRALVIFALIGVLIPSTVQAANPAFVYHPAAAENDALLWIRDTIPHNAVIITDSMFYTDLHEQGGEGVGDGIPYADAFIYWNVARDPAIYNGILHENWNTIDYLVVDAAMLHDIQSLDRSMLLLNRTLHHSLLVAQFPASGGDQADTIQIYQVIHTNQIY